MTPSFGERVAAATARWCRSGRARNALPPAAHLADARSVLVAKLDAIGDFVLVTPFLRELRAAAPRARITLVTSPAPASLAAACPYVDDFATLPPDPRPHRLGHARRVLSFSRFLEARWPRRRFDLATIPRAGPDLQHARLLAYVSGAPERVGYTLAEPPIPARAVPNRIVPYPDPPLHEVEASLHLLQALGVSPKSSALDVHCSRKESEEMRQMMAASGIPSRGRLLALGAGASLESKRWPIEHFLRLARHFVATGDWTVVFLGDRDDARRLPPSEEGWLNCAGRISPAQATVLLRDAALFIGNDSGAVHLAAAAGCPCVVVEWNRREDDPHDVNSHRRFHPWGVPYVLVHPPGNETGAERVPYDEVLAAALELLARDPRRVAT